MHLKVLALFSALSCLVFHFRLCSFCWWGRRNIFAPGRLAP